MSRINVKQPSKAEQLTVRREKGKIWSHIRNKWLVETPEESVRPTVDKLLGAVSKFGASEGLFVSWSGFKTNVQKELAPSFFKVRLWTRKELLEQLFAHYDELGEELRAELPLKRIWTVATSQEE